MLLRTGAINKADIVRYNAMIEAAAGYIVRNGPATPQDRWEEDPGYSPFTLTASDVNLLASGGARMVPPVTSSLLRF